MRPTVNANRNWSSVNAPMSRTSSRSKSGTVAVPLPNVATLAVNSSARRRSSEITAALGPLLAAQKDRPHYPTPHQQDARMHSKREPSHQPHRRDDQLQRRPRHVL